VKHLKTPTSGLLPAIFESCEFQLAHHCRLSLQKQQETAASGLRHQITQNKKSPALTGWVAQSSSSSSSMFIRMTSK